MCDRAYHITGFGCTGEVCTDSRGEKGQCTVPERLANCEKVRVRIIHGLTLVIKNSYTYCKGLLALEAKYYYACPQGGGWQELTIARPRPLRKGRQSIINHAPTSQHNERLHVHASGITNLNTNILLNMIIHQYLPYITISISQNYCKESNISYSVIYKFYVGFYD